MYVKHFVLLCMLKYLPFHAYPSVRNDVIKMIIQSMQRYLPVCLIFKFKLKKNVLPQIHWYTYHIHTGILRQWGWRSRRSFVPLLGVRSTITSVMAYSLWYRLSTTREVLLDRYTHNALTQNSWDWAQILMAGFVTVPSPLFLQWRYQSRRQTNDLYIEMPPE